MVYYGLSLSAEALSGSTYQNFLLLSMIEFPGVAFSVLALRCIGRRPVLAMFLLLGGVFCAVVPFIPDGKSRLPVSAALPNFLGSVNSDIPADLSE